MDASALCGTDLGGSSFVAKPAWIPISPAPRAKRIAPGAGWSFWLARNDARSVSRVQRWSGDLQPCTGSALTAMTSTAEEKAFLRVAVAAIPRVTEIIQGFPRNDRAGALETAERTFLAAALDYGCTEIAAQSRVSALMRRLRSRLEREQAGEKKLQALLQRLRQSD